MEGRAAVVWIADRRWICIVLLVLIAASPCEGAVAARPPEPEVARCIRQAARGQSWLEKTLWGLRDQEAGWIGAGILNSNGSHDLGPLQINSWWVPRIAALLSRRESEVRRWLQFDPCFNAEAARWIFLDALKTGGSYWKAIGIYHSPDGHRQRRYAVLVAVHLHKRFGPAVFGRRVMPRMRTQP
jgi:hypothetical protein